MKKFSGWIIALIVIVVIGVWTIGSYNSLVSSSQNVQQSYSNIQADLQRRSDLIPNLVATVKGYAAHEKSAIDSVTSARAQLAGAKTINEQAAASDELSGALSRLLVVVENYPNLKADANFRALMDELEGTENRIKNSRRDYNDAVKTYNTKVKSFPSVIFARMFGFNEKPYFEATPGAETAPKVSF